MIPNNVINQFAYLRAQRRFPTEAIELVSVLDRTYVDIAQIVNQKSTGIFPENRPAITGNSYYQQNSVTKKESLRQVYPFTSTGSITHAIPTSQFLFFPNCYGYYTDGTNFYGLLYGSNVVIAGQVSFYVTPTDIVIISGGGAPTIVSGSVYLEWTIKN